MIETELAAAAAHFGTAGLIAWMWLSERRAASGREAELRRAHERLIEDRRALEALLGVVRDNTQALASVEAGLRELSGAVTRLGPLAWRAAEAERRGAVRGVGGSDG